MAEQFKDGLEHLPLRERVAARAKAVAEMAAELTGTSPGRSGDMDTLRDKLNETGGLAKLLFEQQFIRHGGRKPADPEWSDLDESERDEWWDRALDAGPLIEGERSSRQAWAEEALRLQEAAAAEPWGCDECMDADPEKPLCDACYRPFTFCSCVSDEQAAALAEAGFTRPQCTVHPDGGAA